MAKTRFPVSNSTLLIAGISLALMALSVALILLEPDSIRLLGIGWRGFGGGGGCLSPYYDRQGQVQDMDGNGEPGLPSYTGDAPLYFASSELFDDPDKLGKYKPEDAWCPESLPVEEVLKLPEVYPVTLEANLDRTILESGNSMSLNVAITVGHRFLGKDNEAPLVVQPGEPLIADLTLDATNFKFQDEPKPVRLNLGRTSREHWSIAPTEDATGEQTLYVRLQLPDNRIDYGLKAEVIKPPPEHDWKETASAIGGIIGIPTAILALLKGWVDVRKALAGKSKETE